MDVDGCSSQNNTHCSRLEWTMDERIKHSSTPLGTQESRSAKGGDRFIRCSETGLADWTVLDWGWVPRLLLPWPRCEQHTSPRVSARSGPTPLLSIFVSVSLEHHGGNKEGNEIESEGNSWEREHGKSESSGNQKGTQPISAGAWTTNGQPTTLKREGNGKREKQGEREGTTREGTTRQSERECYHGDRAVRGHTLPFFLSL